MSVDLAEVPAAVTSLSPPPGRRGAVNGLWGSESLSRKGSELEGIEQGDGIQSQPIGSDALKAANPGEAEGEACKHGPIRTGI